MTLETFRERAASDDTRNSFFDDTHRDLLQIGHYTANLPTEVGGGGLDLVQMGRRQRLLGRYAPAPALATCMHLYWTGAAADLSRMGLEDLGFVIEGALAGEIFAAGHAEAGNDLPTTLSTTIAEPVDGGYRLTGRKHFGSLGPVWTVLGAHAMDSSDPENPRIVHAFVRRDDAGVEVIENWDTMTMRASQSYDTVLEGVFVPHERVGAVVGAADESPVLGAFFTWALTLISNVYVGIAERCLELAITSAGERTSIGLNGRSLAHNPMVQHQIAEAWMAVDGVRSQLEQVAADWVAHQVGPDWLPHIVGAKHRTAVEARRAIEICAQIIGGSSITSKSEIARLWRDSRGIAFHPPPDALAHEIVAKQVLGIDPTGPRW
jgi:alkylation response protein AidB-like acyl-CoA dehydrogenase